MNESCSSDPDFPSIWSTMKTFNLQPEIPNIVKKAKLKRAKKRKRPRSFLSDGDDSDDSDIVPPKAPRTLDQTLSECQGLLSKTLEKRVYDEQEHLQEIEEIEELEELEELHQEEEEQVRAKEQGDKLAYSSSQVS